MFQVKKQSPVGYEDLMRELASIEQHLLEENSSLAMNLMVLEAKIRERFQRMQALTGDSSLENDLFSSPEWNEDALQAMIPQDYSPYPVLERDRKPKQRLVRTVGMAAVLAVLTAVGVFSLATVLQLALTWLV